MPKMKNSSQTHFQQSLPITPKYFTKKNLLRAKYCKDLQSTALKTYTPKTQFLNLKYA